MSMIDELKNYIKPSVDNIIHTQIDLDITNLTISDVMRNINHIYPKNTIERERLSSGSLAIAVLCKSEYLYPLKGVLLIITGKDVDVNINSKKYAVVSICEKDIVSESKIMLVNDKISVYMAKMFKNVIDDFDMFYNRFLYNAYELEA